MEATGVCFHQKQIEPWHSRGANHQHASPSSCRKCISCIRYTCTQTAFFLFYTQKSIPPAPIFQGQVPYTLTSPVRWLITLGGRSAVTSSVSPPFGQKRIIITIIIIIVTIAIIKLAWEMHLQLPRSAEQRHLGLSAFDPLRLVETESICIDDGQRHVLL